MGEGLQKEHDDDHDDDKISRRPRSFSALNPNLSAAENSRINGCRSGVVAPRSVPDEYMSCVFANDVRKKFPAPSTI